MIPGGSGIQFTKLMKQEELDPDIPIVMLTARGEEEDMRGLKSVLMTTSRTIFPERTDCPYQSGYASFSAYSVVVKDRCTGGCVFIPFLIV